MHAYTGFGIFDNSIMILAGDMLESSIALSLSISTMCAAALGTIVSSVLGVGLVGFAEDLSKKLGIQDALLTPYQKQMRSVKLASSGGAVMGVIFGGFVGMIPLLFIDSDDDKDDEAREHENNKVKS
jgi:hypothetical protein